MRFSLLVSFAGNSTGERANPKSGLIADRNGALTEPRVRRWQLRCKPREPAAGPSFRDTKHGSGGIRNKSFMDLLGLGDGQNPLGGLALHDGVLFGTTSSGSGSAKDGTVFALDGKRFRYIKTIPVPVWWIR